jgi:hypothetical protein
MLLAFLNLGPELVLKENVPIPEDELYQKSTSLGIYLSLVVGQGKGIGRPGLYGPLPWSEIADHLFLVFAFYIEDDSVTDPRVREEGVLVYAIIIIPKEEDQLIQARLALERSFKQVFIPADGKLYSVPNDEPLFLLSQLKLMVWKTIMEGEKLIQEKALETVLDNTAVDALIIVDQNDLDSVLNIKDTFELTVYHEEIISNNDILLTLVSIKNDKFGFLRLNDMDKVVVIKISKSIEDIYVVTLFESLKKSLPLLEQYFFV